MVPRCGTKGRCGGGGTPPFSASNHPFSGQGPRAQKTGPSIEGDLGEPSLLNAADRGSLWTAINTSAGGRGAVQIYQIDTTELFLKNGTTLLKSPNTDYYDATVTVDPSGNQLAVLEASSATNGYASYVHLVFAKRTGPGPFGGLTNLPLPTQPAQPVTILPGPVAGQGGSGTQARVGDYTAICNDPVFNDTVWVFGEIGTSAGTKQGDTEGAGIGV